jgi:hypothetical protein
VKIEDSLPEFMRVPGRAFIYRTPAFYDIDFVGDDLKTLLGDSAISPEQI